jgi:hypothetical protein
MSEARTALGRRPLGLTPSDESAAGVLTSQLYVPDRRPLIHRKAGFREPSRVVTLCLGGTILQH